MIRFVRRAVSLLLCLCLLSPALTAGAEENKRAENISSANLVTNMEGIGNAQWLFDGDKSNYIRMSGNVSLTLEAEQGIGSLYLIFDVEYGSYTLTDNDTGAVISLGENGFLHEFVPLDTVSTSVTLAFDNGPVLLNEIYVFTEGEVPAFVQKWEAPKEGETDLVLFSTHGDDEHLFFAGILPYYSAELQYQVQVVYLTNHRNLTNERCHEMLNGLWAVGVDTYPVFGEFPDYFTRNMQDAYSLFSQRDITQEQLLSYVVEQLRRFKPKVAVGHDPINGEYRHGAHMLYADLLMKAVEISNDPAVYPELAEKYGIWDVPKTYLHLYPENPILMDWDKPLSYFGGMTAFEASKSLGFICHESQYNDFAWYLSSGETAAQIPNFSPREFGLYRSTVGADTEKNDFFENLTTYAEDARIRAEEQARLEAEQLEAQRRAEEEARLAGEARQREEEASRQAQKARLDQEMQTHQKTSRRMYAASGIAVISLILLVVLVILFRKLLQKK